MKSGRLQAQLQRGLKVFLQFRVPLFLLLVVAVYGFVALRFETLKNAQADLNAVASKAQASPHIDQVTVNKIQQLQDNSVSVQALFNKARQNPFQE